MVVDIASSLIRSLASYGVDFSSGFLNTLRLPTCVSPRTPSAAIATTPG
ncbi:MAG: hypothetical protein MZW92_53135 [Comamonadaceae bacterium]|nr:hypothetical protein [Comamonadaceae bacterium]